MIPLFFFGVQIERHMGSSEFLLYYLGTGTLAGLFSLLIFYLTGQHLIPLVGASGAIFAVLLAFATYFPNARIFILGIFPMKATTLVLVYGGIELFNTLFVRNTGVAHLTHLAGLGFGYLYFLIREGINPIKVFMDSSRRY
jgi:membrane associated rhomboid family serine protease